MKNNVLKKFQTHFSDLYKCHHRLTENIKELIYESRKAHEYTRQFCYTHANHLQEKMDEISRDFAIITSRWSKLNDMFAKLTVINDQLSTFKNSKSKECTLTIKEWIDAYTEYNNTHHDIEEWLDGAVTKWMEYEKLVMKHCEDLSD